MTITNTHTKTAERIYELLTENTGKHFLDSGMSDGRHWQQNQKHSFDEWLNRPSAILETEYGTYPVLDLFHFLNDRLTLTERAESFQKDFKSWIEETPDGSPYSCDDMEQWVEMVNDNPGLSIRIANSYNWENFLSQTIQYIDFENDGASFVMLQIHGGADVRGGYTHPQIFETSSVYWSYDMTNATIQCTGENCKCEPDAEPCNFLLDIQGTSDVYDVDGSLWDGDVYELKVCPNCGGTLEAIAPEPSDW
jgi:hypothetical protein